MKRIHLIISGDVQGVGFRAWAKSQAKQLQLTGWVTNRPDGAVEIVADGEEASVNVLRDACKKGPDIAWVEHVQETIEPVTNKFPDFRVLY